MPRIVSRHPERWVSLRLERWPITRFLLHQTSPAGGRRPTEARRPKEAKRDEAIDPALPFALHAPASGGARLTAVNEAALAAGLRVGERLADARARVSELQARSADPAADDTALRRLGLWCTRYTPQVSAWDAADGHDGLFLEVGGSAHLFGGETALLDDLARRLRRFGLHPRLAVAATAGAGWAVTRVDPAERVVVPTGDEAAALAGLPLAGLRLPAATRAALARLGLHRIGDLLHRPRAPFAARFGADLLRRLDQALGRIEEPLTLLAAPPAYRATRPLREPVTSTEAVLAVVEHLMGRLGQELVRDGAGAQALRVRLYRVDGGVTSLDLGLARPSREAAHVARLVALRLDRLAEAPEAGFGVEAVSLEVLAAERLRPEQASLSFEATRPDDTAGCAELIDMLGQRLGVANVRRLHPQASHVPERAVALLPAALAAASAWPSGLPERPPLVLPRAEPAEVLALVPEGPPRRFRWRGIAHEVAHAQGPERIAPEWWRAAEPTRDYYLVEDEAGRRFWLYRAGLYGRETPAPAWFVHGVFP